jgi:sn-glycerol 3-phosphate transport system substrate-binding protein
MLQRRSLLAATTAVLAAPAIARAQTVQKLTFYYPVAVGGPIAAIIDGYCKAFQQETGIVVEPVYAGDYSQTLIKALTAIKSGAGPQFSVLWASEIHSLVDQDILVALDDIGLDADAKRWLDGFYPAFMANSHAEGKTWSVPFQRSTAVFYYNKSAFADAGLDPEKFPTTWAGLATAAGKLTKRDPSGRVTRWGVKMAGDLGNAQWTFGAFANQAEQILMNQAGTEVYFNQPKTIEAMAFWRSLSADHHVTPEGVSNWPQLSPDFLEGNTAIIQFTTGGLSNFLDKAKFPFGMAGLAGKNSPHTVVGGANMYFFRSASPADRIASLRFARWVSAPERAADWSAHTGYIATSPAAYETQIMKDHIAKVPAAGVGRTFLPVATGELSVHENQRIYKVLTDNIQACLNGSKTPAQAMGDAQSESDRVLKPYKRT